MRERISGCQEERRLSWFTLGMKVSVSVWVPLNVKLEKRIWVLYLVMIPGTRREGVGELERKKTQYWGVLSRAL